MHCIGSISNHEILFRTHINGKENHCLNLLFKINLEEHSVENIKYNELNILGDFNESRMYCGAEGMGLHPLLYFLAKSKKISGSIIGITKENNLIVITKEYLEILKEFSKKINVNELFPQGHKNTNEIICDYISAGLKFCDSQEKNKPEFCGFL